MQPVRNIHSRSVVLPIDNIDTDQVIPGRFLTTTSREGLGAHLFQDWRYRPDGSPDPEFVLNTAAAEGCQVLVTGHNFGGGSSREHAPWALLDHGFRAVVSTGIADIFRSNALKNGLLPIIVDEPVHRWLLQHPGAEVHIDVAAATLALPDGATVSWPIDGFSRHCLLEGVDQLGFLLQHGDRISEYEARRSSTT